MSFVSLAKMLGLPPEVADALPALAEKIPDIVNDAREILAHASGVIATVDERFKQLDRIENKLDVLGQAVIRLMEEREGHVVNSDSATAGNSGSGNCSTPALTTGNGEQ
jgi:hypothetical protein